MNINYFKGYPRIQRAVTQLTEESINSPMVMDIKNNPRLADYQFYLDNNPELIPGALIFCYTYILDHPSNTLNVNNIISDDFEKNTVINTIIGEIELGINNRRELAREVPNLSNEELVVEDEPGIELPIRPIEAIPEELPIDVNLLPVEATIVPGENISISNLPTARHIELGGKTKKRRNKFKKGKRKTKSKKSKNSKNSKKSKKLKTKKCK